MQSRISRGTPNTNSRIRQLNTSKIGQDLIQITPADQSSGSDSSSNDPLGGLGGIINGIPGLDGIFDNLTNSVDQGLNDLSGTILGNLTEALGVKDTYRLYTTKMCQGSFRNEDDPNSGVDIDSCFTYRDQGQGRQCAGCVDRLGIPTLNPCSGALAGMIRLTLGLQQIQA